MGLRLDRRGVIKSVGIKIQNQQRSTDAGKVVDSRQEDTIKHIFICFEENKVKSCDVFISNVFAWEM